MRTPRTPSRPVLLCLLALCAVSSTALLAQAPVAVVVNRSNPQNNITMPDLRDLYLGALTRFRAGERVVLLEYPEMRSRFYDSVLQMSESRVKRHWIGLVFSGEGVIPPREIRAGEEVVRYVARHPGALAFVPLRMIDSTVKVLSVDGLQPADARYPIR